VKGQERFLYRAVDATGQTIDFLLTAKRDAAAAKRFFRRTLANPGDPMPRVINVDKNRLTRWRLTNSKRTAQSDHAAGYGNANT
jgi:transposase, IS6 family